MVRWEKGHKVRLELMGDPENKIVFQVGICEVLALHKKAPAPKGPGLIQLQIREILSSRVESMEPVETWLTKQIRVALQAMVALLGISSSHFWYLLLGDFILS